MFRDTDKKTWPTEINENTTTIIILNAIEEYIGGEALDSEMEPGNPKTVQAMKDLETLVEVLWKRYGKFGRDWGELAHALEQRLMAKKEYLANFNRFNNSERKESKIS